MPTETWQRKILRHSISFLLTFFAAGIAAFAMTFDAAIVANEGLTQILFMNSVYAGVIAGVRAILKILKEVKV